MMGASASAGGGGAASYTDLVAGVECAGRGYGVTGAERVVQGCSKSGPKFGPPGGPANPSTLLFPLCFQYTFLKGNHRRPARRSRFGLAWRTRNETENCARQSEISQPPTQEIWNLSSTIHPPPPRVIPLLERRAAAPFHPARSPNFQPPIDETCNPSHIRANINHIQPCLRRGPRASAFN